MENTHVSSREYVQPAFRQVQLKMENAICDSPLPGGSEDIGYEDF